ncbi:MAG: protein translocase subunit SecF, partial [Nannocystaceae bacterium]
YQFVKNSRKFIFISVLAIVMAIATMVFNLVSTGTVLNFGIDFQGGSTVRLELKKDSAVGIEQVRSLLTDKGYEGSSAVTVPDAENQVLIRVKDVTTIKPEQFETCKKSLDNYKEAKLVESNYPEGGSKVFLKFDAQPTYSEIEKLFNQAGCEGKADKGIGKEGEFPVEISLIGIGAKITEQFNSEFGAHTVDHIVSSETVGPKVGEKLKSDGITSLLSAMGLIFFYVLVRFDLRFAPGGIVAVAHDSVLVIGAFAIAGKEFNLQIIAALLTVVGYSINDTIVVFDRIRERIALHRDAPIEETTNTALNETLSRTILTSGTTLLVVLAIWVLGSGPIKDFAFALFVGVIVGTYSSLFIASPLFLWINNRFYGGEGHLKGLENREREGTGMLLAGAGGEVDDLTGKTVDELRSEARDKGDASTDVENAAEEAASDKPKKASRRRRRRPRT